ncbi:MAG: hypothetical protein JF567_10665, partial [Xanthomonadales bacterium]|nr:hypothetical protein [Xanthomonadales bacterium]
MSDRNLRIQVLLAAIDKVSAPFRAVSKASSATSRAFKETRDQLKALDRSQRDLEGFSQLEQGIVSTNLQLRQARQDAANLGRQFAAVDAPTKSLTNQFNRARDAVARLEVKQRDEIRDLGALKTRLDAAGMASEGFAGMQERIQRETAAANQVLDKQKTKLAQLGERQARIAKAQAVAGKWRGRAGTAAAVGIGAGGGAAAIAMPLKDELDQSNEFESRMTDIAQKADLGRVAAEAMGRQLRQTALDVN